MKDLYIPISIVIAGVFIGAGLYFGGVQPTPSDTAAPQAATAQAGGQPQRSLTDLFDEAGVAKDAVDSCMSAGDVDVLVQEDIDNALLTGGRGTPWSIVVGPSGKKYPLNGALPKDAVEQIIELAREEGDMPMTQEELGVSEVTPVSEADHVRGAENPTVTIIEYSDFDCPFCSRFHSTMKQIIAENDDVAWVYRHFPLVQLHPNARTVAQISECVAAEGGDEAFWTFADGYLSQ